MKVGRDLILDMGDNARLSDELLTVLKHRGILTLAQASLGMNTLTRTEIWRRTVDLVGEQDLDRQGLRRTWIGRVYAPANKRGTEATHQGRYRSETATRQLYHFIPYQTCMGGNSIFGNGNCN